jgi:hypothetical protein
MESVHSLSRGKSSDWRAFANKGISSRNEINDFKPEVYEVKSHEKILWGGSFLRILYRGYHAFLLEIISENKTRFRQIERFMGPMVLFMGGMIKKTEIGYHQMNIALKELVERNKLEK